jgi:O-antigen/teichoic acid export membrane protein
LVDQAIASLSNGMLSILVARAVSTDAFGAFAIAFTVYTFTIGVSRAASNQPLVIRHSGTEGGEFRAAAAAAAGAACLLGLAAAVLVALVLPFTEPMLMRALLVTAVVLPALHVQDLWRSILIVRGRPEAATANDTLWTVAALGGMLLLQRGSHPVWSYVAVWGGAGALAAVYGCRQLGLLPNLASAWGWLREHAKLSGFLLGEYITALGAVNLATLLLGVISSTAQIGAFRGANTLLGPLNIMMFGAYGFAVPELVRRPSLSKRQELLAGGAIAAVLSLTAVAWGVLVYLIPDRWGTALLGASWAVSHAVVLPAMLVLATNGVIAGAGIVLQARGLANVSFRLNTIFAPILVGLACWGAYLDGARGCALGFAAAHLIMIPLWWRKLVTRARPQPNGRPVA